jgi:hypothetical protein
VLRQQNVLWLDVAMNHAVPMRIIQCVRHFDRDLHRLVDAELRFAVKLCTQRFAFDEWHYIEEESGGGAAVE